MDGSIFAYLFNPWALAANGLVIAGFGMKAYDIWAKTWAASSGKHKVKGKITYTEFREPNMLPKRVFGDLQSEGMICFAYYVDSKLHTGTLPVETLTSTYVEKHLQPGQEIDIYFSPRAPQIPFPDSPPSRSEIIRNAMQTWLLTPLAFVNVGGYLIWHLAQQA